MTARHLFACSAAAAVFGFAGPVLAHPDMPYEDPNPDYQYARPAAPNGSTVFEAAPVVQPLPAPSAQYYQGADDDYYYDEAPPPPATYHHAPAPHAAPVYRGPPVHSGYAAPPPYPPQFDRDAWLDECRDRTRGKKRKGAIIGGLLGAIGGGVAGNRIFDEERLGATLIGAGAGGLVGMAIGAAVGAVAGNRSADECELYLDRYLSGYGPGYAPHYPGYGHQQPHGYGYAQPYGYGYGAMMMVPVTVAIPQRTVVREYVTEEWVDEEVVHHPQPVKRVRVIREAPTKMVPTKRIRYRKGD